MKKNIRLFDLKSFIFYFYFFFFFFFFGVCVVKVSVYLNRRVFVMQIPSEKVSILKKNNTLR